jgi:hypothetical protein
MAFGTDMGHMNVMDWVFATLNGVLMVLLLVCIVRSSRSAADREYLPGFVLVGVALVGMTLYELRVMPREWGLAAGPVFGGIATWGGVLVLRLWNHRRSRGTNPS